MRGAAFATLVFGLGLAGSRCLSVAETAHAGVRRRNKYKRRGRVTSCAFDYPYYCWRP